MISGLECYPHCPTRAESAAPLRMRSSKDTPDFETCTFSSISRGMNDLQEKSRNDCNSDQHVICPNSRTNYIHFSFIASTISLPNKNNPYSHFQVV